MSLAGKVSPRESDNMTTATVTHAQTDTDCIQIEKGKSETRNYLPVLSLLLIPLGAISIMIKW